MGDGQNIDVHHVVAGLLVDAGKVFRCHRSDRRRWYPHVWVWPGGRIEPDELAAVALVRDLHVELGILIREPTRLRVRSRPVVDMSKSAKLCQVSLTHLTIILTMDS